MVKCGFIREEAKRIALCNRMDADSVEGRIYFPGGYGLLDIDVDENGNLAFWFYAGAQMRQYNDNPIYRKHEEHENPRLTYKGGAVAMLERRPGELIFLRNLPKAARKALRRAAAVTVNETKAQGNSLIRSYGIDTIYEAPVVHAPWWKGWRLL